MNYKVIKKHSLLPVGVVLEEQDNGTWKYESDNGVNINLSRDMLHDVMDYLEEVSEDDGVKVSLVDEVDESIHKWRVEFEVECKKSELVKIQDFINENLPNILK